MATKTITRMYDDYNEGARAVTALENAGIAASDISIVSNKTDSRSFNSGTTGSGTTGTDTETAAGTGAGTGATLGTVVGGGAGLLAGLGALAIPGIGPLVAAGWLVATLAGAGVGASAGGLIGSLTGAGVSHDDAHVYAEGVRRGGTLVTVRAEESRAAEVEALLGLHPHVDVNNRGDLYRAEGWERFDDKGAPYAGARTGSTGAMGGSALGTGLPVTDAGAASPGGVGLGNGGTTIIPPTR